VGDPGRDRIAQHLKARQSDLAMLETATVGILARHSNLAMTGPELEALRLSLSVALRSVLASLPLAIAIARPSGARASTVSPALGRSRSTK